MNNDNNRIITNKADAKQILRDDFQRYYKKIPDKNFSPARNKAIVEGTIKAYEKMKEQKAKEKIESYYERSDAVVSYLKSIDTGRGSSNMERYFGKRMLAHLRGEEIRAKLMQGLTIMNNKNSIIRPNDI